MSGQGNVQLEKCPVEEIAARGNVWSRKCQVGEVSVGELSSREFVSRGSVGRGYVQSGKCPRIGFEHIHSILTSYKNCPNISLKQTCSIFNIMHSRGQETHPTLNKVLFQISVICMKFHLTTLMDQ